MQTNKINMDSNEVIAKFMGTEVKMDMMGNETPNYKTWNDLMPVVVKIIDTYSTDFFMDRFDDGFYVGLGTDGKYSSCERSNDAITSVYNSVYFFILWINKNHPILTPKTPIA